MRRERRHLALVVGDHGAARPLTLEDVTEDLAGALVDEFDTATEQLLWREGERLNRRIVAVVDRRPRAADPLLTRPVGMVCRSYRISGPPSRGGGHRAAQSGNSALGRFGVT